MAQEFAKAFYKSAGWRKCRAAFIAKRMKVDGGLCQMCRQDQGYIVHHAIWLTPDNIGNPDVALNENNFIFVCHNCHNKIETGDENLYFFDDSGQIQPLYTPP